MPGTIFGFEEQKRKIMIICQGEGKGHLTQAIAFCEAAKDCDVKVYITKNDGIPKYADKLKYKTFESLTFKFNKDGSVNNWKTFWNNIKNAPKIIKSGSYLKREYKDFKPDMVVSFYEILGGLLFNNSVSIAHQYKFLHPDYKFPNKPVNNFLLKFYTRLTCLRSSKVYALSWYEMRDYKKIKVIPPILRKEIYEPSRYIHEKHNFVLAYVKGTFSNTIIKWGLNQDFDKKVLIYTNDKAYKNRYYIRNVYFKPIGIDFIDRIKDCSHYISNAGFESISEALLWNKPVFVKPIDDQYEQQCNANDIVLNKLGNSGVSYFTNSSINFLNQQDVSTWIRSGENICSRILVDD